ncbi:elongation factor Tu, putative [Plasmodium gallinaceum]|uniref:Elongation factor Tu, putative n=1 Tax=Plasmodium gallinaceum TaxID=5849 RepID=A0A1J1GWC7_PLAGA|nr:elongation factor Tu, putative [Plasmodium gallinaceum]CRG96859.1 elongation factor Tu, putative [Plasmodium gallinaceum]
MGNKKKLKNLVYDDYKDDFEDYDNYDDQYYSEFEFVKSTNSLKIKNNDNSKKNIIKKEEKKENIKKKNEEIQITLKNSEDNKYIMLNTLNILVLGHIDAGKSTLIGALLYNLNYVSEQTIKKYEKVKESCKYTFILDEEDDERERNITLFNKRKEFFIYYTKNDIKQAYDILLNNKPNEKNMSYNKNNMENVQKDENKNIYMNKSIFEDFYKKKIIHSDIICFRKINIFDTPGHNELVNNLLSWSFFADCAILLVDANNIYNKKNDETYKDISILKSVGISNVIIVVNKLDLFDYDIKVFENVCNTVKSFFECEKNDSIFEFIINNNFYIHVKCFENYSTLFEKNLIFTPVSAYKNKNIVKFEKGNISLFNCNFSLYDEIKYMNIKKDLFLLKVCEEILHEKKQNLSSYYNFIKNNKLFANNIFYNSYKSSILNPIKKTSDEDNTFIGVIQDFTEANNLIKANIKILDGILKIQHNYTILPLKEKITIKKIEKNSCFYKYVNIDNLSNYLAKAKNFNSFKKFLLELPDSGISEKIENQNLNEQNSKNCECIYSLKEKDFINSIQMISKLANACSFNENITITNDIVENIVLKINDNKIINGCVLVNNETKSNNYDKNNENFSLYNINNIFISNKMMVLIKINEIQIPVVIGRQYLLYSLNFSHSITIKNIHCIYKNKNCSFNSSDLLDNNLNSLNQNLTEISNSKNYKKKNNTFYEKIENKKCLRSFDIGIIEIEINNNSLMCAQKFKYDLNYFISFYNYFFNIYDFLSFAISPLSRFILSESNKIVASGLILSEE